MTYSQYALEKYKQSLEGSIIGVHSGTGTDKKIFLMKNGKKHLFPNADTFVSHGYDFLNTKMEREVYGNWIESGPNMEKAA
jgi:hypothetical protein